MRLLQNCAIKPPAPVALRERHRRLCVTCIRAPVAILATPALDPDLPFNSDAVQQTLCKCDSTGVWLCQPCGKSIRGADHEYQWLVTECPDKTKHAVRLLTVVAFSAL